MEKANPDYTPFKYGIAGNERYRQILLTVPELQRRHATDMQGRWIGPFDPHMFMRELMPIADEDMDTIPKGAKFHLPKRVRGKVREKRLYQLFEETVEKHDLSPNLEFYISADTAKNRTDLRPDGGMKEIHRVAPTSPHVHPYNTRANAAAIEARANNPQDNAAVAAEASTAHAKATDMSQAFDWRNSALLVEFKRNSGRDPFKTITEIKTSNGHAKNESEQETSDAESESEHQCDTMSELPHTPENQPTPDDAHSTDPSAEPPVFFEKDSVQAKYTLGQLAIYASEMFGHQQRTHIFQLLIAGHIARFIFFDHSGAIVSDAVDYVKNSDILVEFFWRLNHMSKVARGWDPTARQPEDKDITRFKEVINAFLEEMNNPDSGKRQLPNAELTLSPNYDIHKMLVTDAENKDHKMELLIQGPMFKATSALGRCTRGYVSVPTLARADDEPLFLKDTWRVNHHLMAAEAEVYKLLEKYGVPHIPRLICGGDVKDANGNVQKTISVDWVERQTLKVSYEPLRKHSHHRILQRVAYPIESAVDSREFVEAFVNVFDTIEAAEESDLKAKHRDISIGNVMLEGRNKAQTGLLGDWDHATIVRPLAPGAEDTEVYKHQNYRTGTWAFMSIRVLQDPRTPHELFDDLESVFWTMLYGALHRFRHSRRIKMEMFSEASFGEDGKVTGGDAKTSALVKMAKLLTFECLPLKALLVSLSDALLGYYTALSHLDAAKDNAALDGEADDGESDPVSDAQEVLDFHYRKLSRPSFWRGELKRALKRSGWFHDVANEDWYAKQTQEEATQKFELKSRTSFALEKPRADAGETHHETEKTNVSSDSDESSCEEFEDDELSNVNDGFHNLDGVAPFSFSPQNTGSPDLGPSPPTSPSEAQFVLNHSPLSSTSETESRPVTAKRSFFAADNAVAGPSNVEQGRRSKRFKVTRDWPSSPTPEFAGQSATERAQAIRTGRPRTGEPSVIRPGASRYEHWMVTRARARGTGRYRTAD